MNPLDQLLNDTLDPATADVLTREDTLRDHIADTFKGSSRFLVGAAIIDTALAGAMFIVSVIAMFRVDDLRLTVIWAASAVFFGLATGFLKLWFFTRLNRNQVLREIKRLELGIALLSEKADRVAAHPNPPAPAAP